ncbi:MAG TPA: ABC transporter permease [Cyclobacteriaceae bacterium]|nr:ABC transporter permease [Cyclobacteriaceae bacterium]
MKNRGNTSQPPGLAVRFLEWYCRPELLEDLQGDLNEFFERNVKKHGLFKARIIYIIDVFRFIRPYTLNKPDFINLLIHWIMIGSYIKTSGRNIIRNKLFSSINIIGLAASMSVGLLMIAFTLDMLKYDGFHENKNRIYRVIDDHQYLNEPVHHMATTSIKAGNLIREKISGVEDLVIMQSGFQGDFQSGNNVIPIRGFWAESSFFNIFSFQLIDGNPETALKDPYSVVVTEKTARKLFGDEDPIGKTIVMKNHPYSDKSHGNYVITGVMKDISKFSHMRFEALGSFPTLEIIEKENDFVWKWESIWQNYVYILLPKGGAPANLQANLERLSAEENANMPNKNTRINLSLQPLTKIALGKDLSNPIGPTMSSGILWFISGMALIVLLSACFNYTNLSMARSLQRSREIGIRKVIGAFRSQVVIQFVSESVLISLLSLGFAFAIYLVIKPNFLALALDIQNLVSLELSANVILGFITLAVVTGFIAGILPALFYSKINAIKVIKGASSMKVFRSVNMRKILIAFQFTLSLVFVTSTLIIYKQYKDFITFDLGFQTENILNIELQGNKPDIVAKEISEIPGVDGLSKSSMITSVGSYWGSTVRYNDPQDSASVYYNIIDENYIPLFKHEIIAGNNFSKRPDDIKVNEVIVNEQLIKRFNIGNLKPENAIGEFLILDGEKTQISGVIRDFHYGRVDSEIDPFLFRYSNSDFKFINVRLISDDLPGVMSRIEKAWKQLYPVHPFDAAFYDDRIEEAYSEYSSMIKIIGFLAFLAIIIASMGLLGMVVYTTETRVREISIRKVFGAGIGNLIFLLSRSFLFLLVISGLIAIPATYLIFDKIVLSDITYHSPIGIIELFGGSVSIMLLALLLVGSQTFKIARANPAEALKNE